VWEYAIEEVFGDKPDGMEPTWPWNRDLCVACLGILQDKSVPIDEAPTDGIESRLARSRKRKHPLSGLLPPVNPSEAALPVPVVVGSTACAPCTPRPAPVAIYPCIFPQLCDSVVTVAREAGYVNIRDYMLAFVLPHVISLREFALRCIVSNATGLSHIDLHRRLPVVDIRGFLRV
jgi:hypothetical protein